MAEEQPTKEPIYRHPAVIAAMIGLVGVIITAGVALYNTNRSEKNEAVVRIDPDYTPADNDNAEFIRVIGSGWTTDERVRVTFEDQRKDVDVDANGRFGAIVIASVFLQRGAYEVRVDGLQSRRSTTATFTVV